MCWLPVWMNSLMPREFLAEEKNVRHAGAMTEELASSLSSDATIFDATIKEHSNVWQPWARAAFPGAVGKGFDINAA